MSNENNGAKQRTSKSSKLKKTAVTVGKRAFIGLAVIAVIAVVILGAFEVRESYRNWRENVRIEKLENERIERIRKFEQDVNEALYEKCVEDVARNRDYAAKGGTPIQLSPLCSTLVETGRLPRR